MKIAVIASLKKGLEHFIFRELCMLEEQGNEIVLMPTKLGSGLYPPKPEWQLIRWGTVGVLLSQARSFVRSPISYLRLLLESVRFGAIVEFVLACHFSEPLSSCDVIYSTFGDRKLFIAYFSKQITGKPLAVEIHAYELYANPNPRLFRRALSACDQIITVTEYNKELLTARFGVPASRVEVVRISVDLAEYRPADKFVVLIIGFFVYRKGHEVLLDAISRLANPKIELWVVGAEGAESETVDVRAMVRARGLEAQVAFFGALSGTALKAMYRSADIFCLPCRTGNDGVAEGFPTVLAEAMAFGKPIITTKHVEIPRVIRNIIVDEEDDRALAEAIQLLYSSPELRAEFGAENRLLAERYFSPRNAQRTSTILARLAENRQAANSQVAA